MRKSNFFIIYLFGKSAAAGTLDEYYPHCRLSMPERDRYAYHFKPLNIADAFQSLFGLSNVKLEEPLTIAEAMRWHKEDLDFADALHLAKSQASRSFATFDKKLIYKALKLTNILISEP